MAGSIHVFVSLNQGALDKMLKGNNGAVAIDLRRRGAHIRDKARRLCPADTGKLRASITAQLGSVGGRPAVRIGSNLEYAPYVHDGTGVYAGKGYITPKNATLLRWPNINKTGKPYRRYQAGKTAKYVFAKRVKGIPGTPYLANALSAGAD